MEKVISWIICSLGLSFFLFEFYLFKKIREKILPKKLLECKFCQGFWPGMIMFIYFWPVKNWADIGLWFFFGLGSGYINFMVAVFSEAKVDEWEEGKEMEKEKERVKKHIENLK